MYFISQEFFFSGTFFAFFDVFFVWWFSQYKICIFFLNCKMQQQILLYWISCKVEWNPGGGSTRQPMMIMGYFVFTWCGLQQGYVFRHTPFCLCVYFYLLLVTRIKSILIWFDFCIYIHRFVSLLLFLWMDYVHSRCSFLWCFPTYVPYAHK